MNYRTSLMGKIRSSHAKVGVVGIGYVGTSVATSAAGTGFTTVGFDIDMSRVEALNREHVKNLSAATDFSRLNGQDIIVICVPTPLGEAKQPDLTMLKSAVDTIVRYAHPGQLVILESSVAPGTTREVVAESLNRAGFKPGKDVFVSFSPERIDPGNINFSMRQIPKVVSGYDALSLELATAFYSQIVNQVIPVTSLEAAELTKILENTFRLVNISFINEISDFARAFGLDIYEVIGAANTKPFGFLPHYPGPGAGGYCIPVLPYYLLAAAKNTGVTLPLTTQAAMYNANRPKTIAQIAFQKAKQELQSVNSPRILLVGIAYKANEWDTRQSVAVAMWNELTRLGAKVDYHDPHVASHKGQNSLTLTPKIVKEYNLIVILTAHLKNDYKILIESGVPVFDTVNALRNYKAKQIYKL